MENHTAAAGLYWRYEESCIQEFGDKLINPNYPNTFSMKLMRYIQPKIMRIKTFFHGIGRHSIDEIAEFSFEDLKAISNLLGDKPYFNGDQPSTIDCTVFGQLVQFVLVPMEIPQKRFVREDCSNLEKFVLRMKNEFWPDWDQMCENSCMDGKKAQSLF